MDDLKYPPTPRGGGGISFLSDFVFPLPLKSVGCFVFFFLFYSPCFMNIPLTFSPPVIAQKAVILTVGPIAVLYNHRAFSVVKYNYVSLHLTEIGMYTS